jgi:hypothetical protein
MGPLPSFDTVNEFLRAAVGGSEDALARRRRLSRFAGTPVPGETIDPDRRFYR